MPNYPVLNVNAYPPIRTLALSTTPVACDASTNVNVLASYLMAPKILGTGGLMVVRCLVTVNNNANNKTFGVNWAGVNLTSSLLTASLSGYYITYLYARDINSQVVFPSASGYGANTTAVKATAIDTSVETTLTVTGQKAVAGDTAQLEMVQIEVLYL